MKRLVVLLLVLLSGCQSTQENDSRPSPDIVVEFKEGFPHFNNSEPVKKAVKEASAVLLVAVANKERAAISSKRVFSVADALSSKRVFTAYRFSNLKSDIEYVEVYGLNDKRSVPKVLAQLKQHGVGELNNRIYSETEFRRFVGEVDEREFALSGFVTLPEQLAGLLNELGWKLKDGGAFMAQSGAVLPAKNIKLSVVTVDKRLATLNEIKSVVEYWKSLYPQLDNYSFQFDARKSLVIYQRGGV